MTSGHDDSPLVLLRSTRALPIAVPEDAPAGPALLRVGWYDWRDGTPLTDAQGRSVVEIARFEIRP